MYFSNGQEESKTYLLQDIYLLVQRNDQRVNCKLCQYENKKSFLLSVLVY